MNYDSSDGATCGQPRRLLNGASGNTCSLTNDAAPSCQAPACPAPDAFFYFIIESSPTTVTTDTCGGGVNHLAAYRNFCHQDFPDMGCNDNCCGINPSLNNTFGIGAYFYVLDGSCGECGPFTLNVTGI
jgi:hypothetical protein